MVSVESNYEMFHETINKLVQDHKMLQAQIADVELSIKDIHHFIELKPNMSGCEGYKIYKKLHETLTTRRNLINNGAKMKSMLSNIGMLEEKGRKQNLNNVKANYNKNDVGKKYRVRILKDEFGTIIKQGIKEKCYE